MLSASRRQLICCRCLSQGKNGLQPSSLALNRQLNCVQKKYQTTQANSPETKFGQDKIPKHSHGTTPKASRHPDQRPIREKLLDWVPEGGLSCIQQLKPDNTFYGNVTNSNTRPQSTGSSELDNFKSAPGGMIEGDLGGSGREDAELAIVGTNARKPGDLVEMKQPGSRTPVFGIYLGYFGDRHHFYTSNGKWAISIGFSALFTVSEFASAAEIEPLLAMLPKDASPDEYQELRMQDKGPSREAGAELIRNMNKFIKAADKHYQSSLTNLDKARSLVSDGKRTKYLSLFEIADILLPKSARQGKSFPASALYAVHTALLRNDFIFRPLSPAPDSHRREHMFEVFPYHDTMMINRISTLVRDYTVTRGTALRAPTQEELGETALGRFVLKARETVAANRQKRAWTPHGILAPSDGGVIETADWTRSHMDIVRYLEWWACYDLFEDASRFHAYGSIILRALDLYDSVPLDQSTAWTFLQEVGMISPWEVPSRYKVRFPEVKIQSGGGLIRDVPAAFELEESKRPDIAAGARREWKNINVLCIDAPSTVLIDDGVSLERTENPSEFWIHIHTADPASGLAPDSRLCRFMELVPQNIYLPGHFQAMLPSEIGMESTNDYKSDGLVNSYSLAAGRPALTFSAKVNESGDLLDYKIEPGVLDKVTYLDPEDVSQFCQEPAPPPGPEDTLTAGKLPEKASQEPNRPMTAAKELDSNTKDDILTLYRLAESIKQRRLGKGAWPYFQPRPSVSVTFHSTPTVESLSRGNKVLPPDPHIRVGYEPSNGASVVSNTMVLAGEIAARWCSDRGIPVPYRKDASAQSNGAAYEYATKELYPLITKGVQPSAAQRQELNRLIGGVEISSTPGPYFMLGLDMYAKATSPLRRFSDLVLHWQVHAALAHERNVQRPLDPSVDDLVSILPFASESFEHMLSLLHMREKMAGALSRGTKDWILMALVRAWKFDKTAPRSMIFTVDSRWRQGLMGRIDLFNLEAILDVDGIHGLVLLKDIKIGDQFEVELADVNVHSQTILVKATKCLKGDEKPAPA